MKPNRGEIAPTTLTIVGIGVTLLGIVIGGLWYAFQLGEKIGRASPDGESDPPVSVTCFGYFRDIKKDKTVYTGSEFIKLSFARLKGTNVQSVSGVSQGKVTDHRGQTIERTWQVRGYRSGDKLVLTYYTANDGEVSRSGVSYLKDYGSIFRGHWVGTDTFSGKDVMGAYILSMSKMDTDDADKELEFVSNSFQIIDDAVPANQPLTTNKSNVTGP
jgi:hypothetical protein